MSGAVKRPQRSDPEVVASALHELALACEQWGGGDLDQWKVALSRCRLSDSAFELAKDLERTYWMNDIDMELLEILDGASTYLWTAHEAAERAWVEANGIKPTLSVGDRISYRFGDGTISGMNAERAVYWYIPDEEREKFKNGGGVHVRFEDAEAIALDADATP